VAQGQEQRSEAPAEQRSEAAEAPREAPSNAFEGGSAGDARAQSARGNASSSGPRGR
jgi:hypothetical protein